jgi:hypothetical protein
MATIPISWSKRNVRFLCLNNVVTALFLGSPGIDSEPGWPVRQPILTYRHARLHRLTDLIPGLLNCLQIRAA